MGEAATMAALMAAASGTGISASAAVTRGQWEKAIARENAERAKRAAGQAVSRGDFQAQMQQMRSGQGEAHLQASLAEGGAGGASAVTADSSARLIGRLEEEIIRNNAYSEATGLIDRASDFQRRGDLAESAGAMGAVGSVIGGIGQMASITAAGLSNRPRGASETDEEKRKRLGFTTREGY